MKDPVSLPIGEIENLLIVQDGGTYSLSRGEVVEVAGNQVKSCTSSKGEKLTHYEGYVLRS